jgi:fimbrial chaperone protein
MLLRSALVTLLWLAPLAQVFAAGFEIRPVLVETTDGLGVLTVSNPGATRIYLQGTLYGWSYSADGVEVLEAISNVIVSPPATWIEPSSEYRFRLRVPQAAPGQELSFRLLLAEVPTRDAFTNGAVVMAVTQSIPIFSQGKSLKPPSLSATIAGSTLSIRNSGGRHVRIAQLKQDDQVVKDGLVGYALSGATLTVPLTAPVRPGRIEFTTDLGPQTIVVTE